MKAVDIGRPREPDATRGPAAMQAPLPDEVHIAGVIVHAHPTLRTAAAAAIDGLLAARVVQQADDGRTVVVIEAPSTAALLDMIEAIRGIRGVMNVAMVYQHAEPASAMEQEIQP